jgi:site-specific DNA-methyltransferase (adenine-specific)
VKPYYEHAGITIYHGDCRELAPLIFGVSGLVSDPPYGMRDKSARGSRRSSVPVPNVGSNLQRRNWESIAGDDQPFDPALWLNYPKVVLFGAVHYSHLLPASRRWLIWDKREGTASDDNADCDFAWTNLNGPARLYSQLWRGLMRRGRENAEVLQHPHQKPIALMRWVLTLCEFSPKDVVLDPYMGSGSTLAAAKELGLSATGIELEERYCEIAAKRLSQEVLPLEAA